MASHRVRLFVLPHNPGLRDAAEEAPGFTVDGVEGDDAIREHIRARLVEWGYTVRAISSLAGVKPGEATYAATVVGQAPVKVAGETGARS